MSVAALGWAWQQRIMDADGKDDPMSKSVLVALANYADEDGLAWPSVGRLADMTQWGTRSIQRCLSKLIKAGFLRREPRAAPSGQRLADGFYLLAPPEVLARRAGSSPGSKATPVRQSVGVHKTPSPGKSPPVHGTGRGDRESTPPRLLDGGTVTTQSRDKDDPSKNLKISARAGEAGSSTGDADPPIASAAEPEFAFEMRAAMRSQFLQRWSAARTEIGAQLFDAFFAGSVVRAVEPEIVVQAQSGFYAEAIETRYGRIFRKVFDAEARFVAPQLN